MAATRGLRQADQDGRKPKATRFPIDGSQREVKEMLRDGEGTWVTR